MSPAPTPATDAPIPPAPTPVFEGINGTPEDHLADAIEHINDHVATDLDEMLAATETPAPFSLTVTADPGAVGGLLAITALVAGIGALAVYAFRRVTSPDARRARTRAKHERLRAEEMRKREEARIAEVFRAGERIRGTVHLATSSGTTARSDAASGTAPMIVVDEHPDDGDRP